MLPIILWFILCLFTALLGRNRAFGFWGFFLASLFLTPFAVLVLLVLTAPSKD